MTCEPFLAVALITGAASGIGAATARLMAPRCRGLVLHTRSDAGPSRVRLAEVAMAAREQGAEVLELTGDLAEAGVARGLVEAAVAKFGGLEHVVANAGYADRRGLEVISRGDFERALAAPSTAAREAGILEEAVGRGVFGVPTFVTGDRLFWGNDRLVLLEHALARASGVNDSPR